MAGVRIEITRNLASPAIARAMTELEGPARQLMLKDMGEYLLGSTRERAARQVSPDGTAWQALSPRYKRQKDKQRPGLPMLKFDNHMLGPSMFSWQVDRATGDLLVGTNAPYGAAQHFGHTYQRKARAQELYFSYKAGVVSPRFVKKRKSNFAQAVNIGAHTVTLPGRPWLGLSAQDETELVEIGKDHLARALDGGK